MTNKSLSNKQLLAVGLTLFALFLGAGNIIFPPYLGQQAGSNIWLSVAGFLVTGVGLPLLAVITIGRVGDLETLAGRVHPVFGIVFTTIIYFAIGPFFGIPRTATVTYEVGVLPFLSGSMTQSFLPLCLLSIVFFGVSAWLSLNPSKLIDRIGKIITPSLLIVLTFLVAKSFITPLGPIKNPTEAYETNSFFNGFIEGYLTMDTIGGLVFGIVVISAIKHLGITNQKDITKTVSFAGVIASVGLILVYLSLTYIGATSVSEVGYYDNGGTIISEVTQVLFGSVGSIILSVTITLACLTTSVGLISACSQYFCKMVPALSYRKVVYILSIFSMLIANVGLSTLISVSLPVLTFIYPLAITLILLSFLHNYFNGYSSVYVGGMFATGLISLLESIMNAGYSLGNIGNLVSSIPLSAQGIGWLIPAIIGSVIGFVYATISEKSTEATTID